MNATQRLLALEAALQAAEGHPEITGNDEIHKAFTRLHMSILRSMVRIPDTSDEAQREAVNQLAAHPEAYGNR